MSLEEQIKTLRRQLPLLPPKFHRKIREEISRIEKQLKEKP